MSEKFRPMPEEARGEIKSEKPSDIKVEKNDNIEKEKLPQVDKETGIYTDENGEEWATVSMVVKLLGLSGAVFTKERLSGVRSIRGRDGTGKSVNLLNLTDIKIFFADHLRLPQVDKETGIYKDENGEQWATAPAAAELFGFGADMLSKERLAYVRSIRGRSRSGNFVNLYNLTDLRNYFADHLRLPQVDKETGIYTDENGEQWVTLKTASDIIGVYEVMITKKRLSKVRSIRGRDRVGRGPNHGQPNNLFNLSDLKKLFADHLRLPQVDKETGIYTDENGEQWVALKTASDIIGVYQVMFTEKRLSKVRSIRGRDRVGRGPNHGQPNNLFNLSDLKKLFADHLRLPQVDKETGIYTDENGEQWATKSAAAKFFMLDVKLFTKKRLFSIRAIRGRGAGISSPEPGQLGNLFNLSDLKKLFADYLHLPQVDKETGIYTDENGERWVARATAAKMFGVDVVTLTALRLSQVRSIRGRYKDGRAPEFGQPNNLFNLSDLEKVFADYITQKKGSAQDRELRESFDKKINEIADGETFDAQKFRSLVDAFGAARCVDILYRLYPEFKGLPIEHIKGTMADYLGDFLIAKGDFHPRNWGDIEPFLSDVTFRESLYETVKDHCLRYFFIKKREEPQRDNLEIIYEYLDNAASEVQGIDSKELDDIIQNVIEYYDAAIRDFEKPEGFKDRLTTDREFPDINQKINMKELSDKKRILIADEMGLGKSASVIMAKEQLGVACALVTAPANVIETWKKYLSDEDGGYYLEGKAPKVLSIEKSEDLDRTASEQFDFILISHERLSAGADIVEKLSLAGFDMLVVDEAHKMKNPKGQRAEQALELAASLDPETGYLALLSGTPVPNKVGDIAIALKMLYPDKFADVPAEELSGQIISGDILDLRSLLMPRMQMKDLRESIDMPELTETIVPISLSPEERDIYEALLEDDEVTATEKMKILRQFLLNPDLVVLDPNLESSKIRACRERLNEAFAEHDKVVMFVNNYLEGVVRGETDIFDKLNLSDDIRVIKIHGNVPMTERKKIEQEFNESGEKILLVVSGQTADVGVDFSNGQKVIFYNEPWTEYQRRQELGRVFRPGVKDNLDSEVLVAEKTIEQGIHEYIWRKYKAVEKLLRGVPITELEKTLLNKTEQAEDPDLEVNPELARYYLSCWDKMMQYFGYAKELGEAKFEKFLADYGRDYAEGYRELGNRSYQANANRISGAMIEHVAAQNKISAKDLKILDMASGPEMLRRHIADDLQNSVVSLDINPHHLQNASGDVINASARKTPFKDKSFDYVNYALAWHYGKFVPSRSDFERAEILAEANRVLKNDGRLVLSLIYSVNVADEEKFIAAVNELGFEIDSEHSGEAVSENVFRSKIYTLKKVRDLDKSPAEAASEISPDNYPGMKIRTDKGSLKNSRKIVGGFTLNGQEVAVDLNSADKEALDEERNVSQEMKTLKDKFEGIKNIPRAEILSNKFARILIGKKFALFKKLERGSGAVVIKDEN
ncbi:MAG: SNF2-related protein [Patescibacteria group bacterium]